MNYSLGKRHLILADNTRKDHCMDVDILVDSIARTWTRPMGDSSREFCDFASAISADDLARINAFEPADPNIKPIGNQSGLWSDVRRGSQAVAAA